MERGYAHYLDIINHTTNPVLERVLLYKINHCNDLGRADLLDTQLTGLATFTRGEVRTLNPPVAALVAATSRDQDLLHEIAEKEKRITVRRGLGRNPHLAPRTVELLMENEGRGPVTYGGHFAARYWPVSKILDNIHLPFEQDNGSILNLGKIAWRKFLYEATAEEQKAWVAEETFSSIQLQVVYSDVTWEEYLDLLEFYAEPAERLYELYTTPHAFEKLTWDVTRWERVLQWDAEADKGYDGSSAYYFRSLIRSLSGMGNAHWGTEMLKRAVHPLTRKMVLDFSGRILELTPEYISLLKPAEVPGLLRWYRPAGEYQQKVADQRLLSLIQKVVPHLDDVKMSSQETNQLLEALSHLLSKGVADVVPEVFRCLDAFSGAEGKSLHDDSTEATYLAMLFEASRSALLSDQQRERLYDLLCSFDPESLQNAFIVPGNLLEDAVHPQHQKVQALILRAKQVEMINAESSSVNVGHLFKLYTLEHPSATEETFLLLASMADDWDSSFGELVDTVAALEG